MIAVDDNSQGLSYMLTDHLGSTVTVTDDTGALISEQRYLPFGAPRQLPDDLDDLLDDTDFTYRAASRSEAEWTPINAAWTKAWAASWTIAQHPRSGTEGTKPAITALNRFSQPDSIVPDPGNPQDLNRFSFVRNNPIRYSDPTGHWVFEDEDDASDHLGDQNDPINYCDTHNCSSPDTQLAGSIPDEQYIEMVYGPGSVVNPTGWDKTPSDITFSDVLQDVWVFYNRGWENHNNAWDIMLDPNTTIGQRWVASTYVWVWYDAHIIFAIGITILTLEAIVPGSISCLINSTCEQEAASNIENSVQRAKQRYPKLADKPNQLHHIFPKYLGGDPKGLRVPLNPAYHQLITNEFRAFWAYGQGAPSIERTQQIIQEVYSKFPLP